MFFFIIKEKKKAKISIKKYDTNVIKFLLNEK